MSKAMWVSILREWFVLSETQYKVGDKIVVEKRDGTTTEEIVEEIVGMFMDSTIYRVAKKEAETPSILIIHKKGERR